MTTMSAREFNRDVSAAKRDAARGPVVITDRGEPASARGRAGIARLGRRDVEQAQRLRTWPEDDLLAVFDGRIPSIDVPVAQRAARPGPAARAGYC